MLIPYRLDSATLAVVAALTALALFGLRRTSTYAHAQGFVEGVSSRNGHRLHSVPRR